MPLDFVVQHFTDAGSSAAIQRFFIDMPMVPNKLCLIRQVHVQLVQPSRILNFGIFFAMSVDPDHQLASTIIQDSTIFLSHHHDLSIISSVGFVTSAPVPFTYHFPEGIKCPYTRLPFFVQHSNADANFIDWVIKVFYEFVTLTPAELAVAVMRRGRGTTRRVP